MVDYQRERGNSLDLTSAWLKFSMHRPFIWPVIGLIGLVPSVWIAADIDLFEVPTREHPAAFVGDRLLPTFDLRVQPQPFRPNFEAALEQLEWSSDPVRPDRVAEQKMLTLRMKDSKELEKVKPPSRVFISFDSRGALKMAAGTDHFWIDASESWFRLGAKNSAGEVVESDLIPIAFQEAGIQSLQELPESSPFRMLAEVRWHGQDQFLAIFEPGAETQRIEFGSKERGELLDLKKSDWLIFNGENWTVGPLSEAKSEAAIVRWTQKFGQTLELEGWEGDLYRRFRLDLASVSPPRKDDLFSQLKIRSEKQVSCTIDQQYLILKPGDWVLKVDQRWKVLRKRDEKEAFLNGKLTGDLFLLDRIEIKNGTKRVVGKLFGPTRTQVVPIDSKPQEPQLRSRKNISSRRVP